MAAWWTRFDRAFCAMWPAGGLYLFACACVALSIVRAPVPMLAGALLEAVIGQLASAALLGGGRMLLQQLPSARAQQRFSAALTLLTFGLGLVLGMVLTDGAFIRHHASRPLLIGCAGVALGVAGRVLGAALRAPPSKRFQACALAVGLLAALVHSGVLRGLYPPFHAALWLVSQLALRLGTSHLAERARLWLPRGSGFVPLLGAVVVYRYAPLSPSATTLPLLANAGPFSAREALADELECLAQGEIPSAPPAPAKRTSVPALSATRVVLVVVDTLRADVLRDATANPAEAERRAVPNLFSLRQSSLRYEQTYTHASITHRAFSALLHGQNHPARMPRSELHLARVIAQSPRRVQTAFVGWSWFEAVGDFVEDEKAGVLSGFERRRFYDYTDQNTLPTLVDETLQAFDATRASFLVVHLACMHDPGFDGAPIPAWVPLHARYGRALSWLDRSIGALRSRLAKDGIPTLLILTADHGEGLGDHELAFHGVHTYEEEIRVPLWLSSVGLAPGEIGELTAHAELAPTIADVFGVPAAKAWGGSTLFGPNATRRSFVHAENTSGREVAIVDGVHKLVWRSSEQILLYEDLSRDPREQHPGRTRDGTGGRALLRELLRARPDLIAKYREDSRVLRALMGLATRPELRHRPDLTALTR